jgi:hypothetical protein
MKGKRGQAAFFKRGIKRGDKTEKKWRKKKEKKGKATFFILCRDLIHVGHLVGV